MHTMGKQHWAEQGPRQGPMPPQGPKAEPAHGKVKQHGAHLFGAFRGCRELALHQHSRARGCEQAQRPFCIPLTGLQLGQSIGLGHLFGQLDLQKGALKIRDGSSMCR